jgi:peptidoglycan/LPS O-acetylase OafA/YrhL
MFFVTGILLALNHERINRIVDALPSIIKFLLLIFALACFIFDRRSFGVTSVIMDYLHMVSAALLIVLAAYWNGLSRLLSIRPFLWLGRISYSMYLIHWVILYAVFELLGDILPYWQLPIIITIISLICADLMARLVEYPCINLGKRITRRFRDKPDLQNMVPGHKL